MGWRPQSGSALPACLSACLCLAPRTHAPLTACLPACLLLGAAADHQPHREAQLLTAAGARRGRQAAGVCWEWWWWWEWWGCWECRGDGFGCCAVLTLDPVTALLPPNQPSVSPPPRPSPPTLPLCTQRYLHWRTCWRRCWRWTLTSASAQTQRCATTLSSPSCPRRPRASTDDEGSECCVCCVCWGEALSGCKLWLGASIRETLQQGTANSHVEKLPFRECS